MLSCVGCGIMMGRGRSTLPTIGQGPMGNAVLATLPVGTEIRLPDTATATQLRALLINEIQAGNGPLIIRAPLYICTPAYIAERDAVELRLHEQLLRLRPAAPLPQPVIPTTNDILPAPPEIMFPPVDATMPLGSIFHAPMSSPQRMTNKMWEEERHSRPSSLDPRPSS